MSVLPLSRRARTAVCAALVAWVAILATTLLAPSAAGPSWLVETVAATLAGLGVPAAITVQTEFALNVAAFVPLSLLGGLLWPRPTWRDWTAYGFVASFLIEVFQAVSLAGRSATHVDVVSNTLGALLGAVLADLLARGTARDPRASEGGADLPDRQSSAQELEPPR